MRPVSDLRAVIRIKTMARAAISDSATPGPDEGEEMANAYERLRAEAQALNQRAGWGSADDFNRELPPIERTSPTPPQSRVAAYAAANVNFHRAAAGRRARVLLGQLAGWAEGHQEAFEI